MSSLSDALDEMDDPATGEIVASLPSSSHPDDISMGSSEIKRPFLEHSLSDLLSTLPPVISFSPVADISLFRRDLYDAKFQVRSSSSILDEGNEGKETGTEQLLELSEQSDLVQGVYEGGLKTWEGGVDLVVCLQEMAEREKTWTMNGKRILELGCGSALPACWALSKLLEETAEGKVSAQSEIFLQDYNAEVLELITLPNLLLTYLQHTDAQALNSNEVPITSELIEAFTSHLYKRRIVLRFFSGPWSSFSSSLSLADAKFTHILTSETIYALHSLPSLIDVMEHHSDPTSRVYVACKSVYFGMEGGVGEWEFRKRVEERKGEVEKVWSSGTGGMERVVLKVEWNAS
ncbi:hypothetical protein BT69DRAFT_1334184 [Atractiella rhizophila]|nr:hypothetical protein BT69DRAFT_1334184 [Atractiella rhizophila]